MRRRMQTGVLVGVVALMLAGCTGTATSTETAKPEAAASVSASESTSDGDEVVIDEDSGLTAADITKLGDPVATAEIPALVDGDPAATMTVNLYGLKRDGKTVVGTYSFTVNTTAPDPKAVSLFSVLGDMIWFPYLVDSENLNKHLPLGGKQRLAMALTDSTFLKVTPGATLYGYAVFAAPPEDVDTMDAVIAEGAPMATDVELR